MKALTDRLDWVRLWMVDPSFGASAPQDSVDPDAKEMRVVSPEEMKHAILAGLLEAIAIAEALPEIPVYADGVDIKPVRKPPERVIELPNG
jgi:hypothetical protein